MQLDRPISPYAATKKACELMAYTYHHLHGLSCTGLRFFTVYGPAGRPDMAPFIFTRNVMDGVPIKRFGDGSTRRDYTYIDDIVAGVVAALDRDYGYEVINLGNSRPIELNRFIELVEEAVGRKAVIEELPMQPGDVRQTYADITKAQRLLDYDPRTPFEQGLTAFVEWYREHRDLYL
jgi:UDP-glucuronate 4-epimerase